MANWTCWGWKKNIEEYNLHCKRHSMTVGIAVLALARQVSVRRSNTLFLREKSSPNWMLAWAQAVSLCVWGVSVRHSPRPTLPQLVLRHALSGRVFEYWAVHWDKKRILGSGPRIPSCNNGKIQSFYAKSGLFLNHFWNCSRLAVLCSLKLFIK